MIRIAVVGIHTEVGKTLVSAILAESLQGFYWKPVQCGLPEDRDWVANIISPARCYPSTFSFFSPCSPHLAAKKEGIQIALSDFTLPVCQEPLIIEGTGGLLTPLNEKETWADAAKDWEARFVLVHRSYLGSLNHFALTMEAIQRRNFSILGVVFNGSGLAEEMLLKKGNVCCLGKISQEKQFGRLEVEQYAKKWRPVLRQALGL